MADKKKKKVTITPSFFPAAEHLLPHLSISAKQHEELRAFALRAARDTIRDGPTWGRSNVDAALGRGWKILSAKPTGCLLIKRHKSSSSSSSASSPTVGMSPSDDKLLGGATGRSPPSTPSLSALSASSSSSASGQSLMAHSVLPYALEDVMNTLYNENTNEMRAATRKVYGDYLLDCCILQTLEGATLDDPFWYLGLKWIALRSPLAKLVASREFVVLEHSGTHVDPTSGARMLYRILQSVHVRGYGGQDSYFGLTRGHIECAFVYWMEPLPVPLPVTPGGGASSPQQEMLHVCMKGRLHPKGSLPLGVLYKYIKRFWKSERSVFAVNDTSSSGGASSPEDLGNNTKKKKKKSMKKKNKARRKRSFDRVVLQGAPLEMAAAWVPDDARPRCSVCRKKFLVLRRLKHHCRACGEVICRACTFYHALNVRDRRALARQTLPTAAHMIPRSTSAASLAASALEVGDARATAANGADRASLMARRTLPSALDRESGMDAQVEASMALLGGEEQEMDSEPTVVTVVTGKVCHRCIHGKSVIIATRRSDVAGQATVASTERGGGVGSHGSFKNLFAASTSTQLVDDVEVDALLSSRGPDEHHHQQHPPRHSRPNYEHVSSSGSALGVWRPGQQQMQLLEQHDQPAMLKQHRLGERAAVANSNNNSNNSSNNSSNNQQQQPRLTDDLPMILADVETGSIAGLDESKTFIGSSGTRMSGLTRPSYVSSQHEAVCAEQLGVAREQPERHDEEDEEEDDGEDDEEDDDESSVAESSSSTTSSLTSSQLRHLMEADGSASSSSRPLRSRRNTIDEQAAVDAAAHHQPQQQHEDEDMDDFEFYPAYATTHGSSTLTLASDKALTSRSNSGDAELDRAFAVWGFDPDCLFELKDDEDEDDEDTQDTDGSLDGPQSLDSGGVDGAKTPGMRRRVQLFEDDMLHQELLADAYKTDKQAAAAGGGKQAEEVLAALTQVESALADQAVMLVRLQQERARGNSLMPQP